MSTIAPSRRTFQKQPFQSNAVSQSQKRRLRSLALNDFVEIVGDWTDSFTLCRRYYNENGIGPADIELVFSGMLTAVFALAARGTMTEEMLDQWKASAVRAGLSVAVSSWLAFVQALFVDNTIGAEAAVRDASLAWSWQAVASIRVAVDIATRPAELLTVHSYWTNVLPQAAAGSVVLADIEHLVTSAWRRLSESRFLLHAPAITVPALLQACASVSSGWRKIGEVLTAACDAVPATVPSEFHERFRELQ
jgi:hypothetical protein